MTGISTAANRLIASKFPWKKYKTAVDVGTAQGDLITQVALANPHIAGIGFDLPEVAPTFEEYVAANGLERESYSKAAVSLTATSPRPMW
jgi:tRNA G46 methylase TrmB